MCGLALILDRLWLDAGDLELTTAAENAAIAAASLAMELIRGKTPEEALKMRGEEFAKDLGPLPPTKVHCTQLVEGAIGTALDPKAPAVKQSAPPPDATPPAPSGNLNESFGSLTDALAMQVSYPMFCHDVMHVAP